MVFSPPARAQDPFVPALHDLPVQTLPDVVLRHPGRDLHVKVYYPESTGLYPVIIFSHGYGANKDAYFQLLGYWASCGYVVVTASHQDPVARLQEAVADPARWQRRVADARLELDSLRDLSLRPELANRMDLSRIGMGGHSFGAFTAMLMADARVPLPRRYGLQSLAVPGPLAFLWMSPQGVSPNGMQPRSWDTVHRPVMVMTGSEDKGIGGQPAAWRLDAYQKLPPGDKYLAYFEGARHLTFVGPLVDRPLARLRRPSPLFHWIQLASVAWWDATLRHIAPAVEFLHAKSLQQASGGAASIQHH